MKDADALYSCINDMDVDKCQVTEDGAGESIEQGCLLVDARPSLEDQSSIQPSVQNSATELESNIISNICQVSLSKPYFLNTNMILSCLLAAAFITIHSHQKWAINACKAIDYVVTWKF